MIQAVAQKKVVWHLAWTDLRAPGRSGEFLVLPTLLVLLRGEGEVLHQECWRELEPRRAERLLTRSFHEYGTPDVLEIQEAEEWEEAAWTQFGRSWSIDTKLGQPGKKPSASHQQARQQVKELGRELARSIGENRSDDARDQALVAEELVEGSEQLRSGRKRELTLQYAFELAPDNTNVRLAVAELAFVKGLLEEAYQAMDGLAQELSCPEPVEWSDPKGRLLLRAMHGRMMSLWHLAKLEEAIPDAEALLRLNPVDHQGVRFLVPLLFLSNEQTHEAHEFFGWYQTKYPKDHAEPGFLMGWGLTAHRMEDEETARLRYSQGFFANMYLAPLLLDLPEPRQDIWQPHERAEADYAMEFCDSFGSLWERDTIARRFVVECFRAVEAPLQRLQSLRYQMLRLSDQRYDPEHEQVFKALVEEERTLQREVFGEPLG